MTSVEGRWVATITCTPTARDFWARRVIVISASFFEVIIRSAISSMTITI